MSAPMTDEFLQSIVNLLQQMLKIAAKVSFCLKLKKNHESQMCLNGTSQLLDVRDVYPVNVMQIFCPKNFFCKNPSLHSLLSVYQAQQP